MNPTEKKLRRERGERENPDEIITRVDVRRKSGRAQRMESEDIGRV